MIRTIAISNYRSLLNVIAPLDRLNVVTGANGSGKSNIYRALRLLAASATGQLIPGLAAEGGLQSALWAGPQSRTEHSPEPMPEASRNVRPVRLQLGFSSDTFSYSVDLGLPTPHHSAFSLDPVIKRECVWLGSSQSPKTLCADRNGPIVRCRNASGEWVQIYDDASPFEGLMTRYADPLNAPELIALRFQLQQWRFYDYLRTDLNAPARQTQIGTRTLCLANDGSNLAAAVQSIIESPNREFFEQAIDDAFPGSQVEIYVDRGLFELRMSQPGIKRAFTTSELSEGTLKYIMLVALLLSPLPPAFLVLNEPESQLHPDLLPALAQLIRRVVDTTQIIVVTHSVSLGDLLLASQNCKDLSLQKRNGSTHLAGINTLDMPRWTWPKR